ncbi:MAG: helix-turn-helix transcriptional regulator [Bacilli bacterium]|nr:helix-turn-helix transcriptional regulator [Bacilli bacterium]MBN2877881.1 helix-turn-helix transcriptional regulator [Bacilli bacterium]
MSFGQNLQFLRKMRNKMTQEELAEKLDITRQTISKWELDAAYPEMNKLIELCDLFSCTMDQLVREEIVINEDAYSDIRMEVVPGFDYFRYAVISQEPEEDAIGHVRTWSKAYEIDNPQIIGWDFPVLSQEQINVFNMHGYAAALILPEGFQLKDDRIEMMHQETQKYIVITIKNPFIAPFRLIPNAYKVLMTHMQVNGIHHKEDSKLISCFEKEYQIDDIEYMDVYIAIE